MRRPLLPIPLLLTLAACGSPRVSWEGSWDVPYGAFDPDLREAFAAARADLDAGRLERARTRLATLVAGSPDNIELGAWLQDAELVLLGEGAPGDPVLAGILTEVTPPDEALRVLYERRARAEPSVARYVLAARAETDAIAAVNLLDRAMELDPTCAWAHYGRAHALLRDRRVADRWARAREALGRALILDPSHLHARRLEAWMFAQEGDTGAAARALEVWLEQTAGDPRVSGAVRHTAQLDLSIAWVLEGNSREAVSLLRGLEGDPLDRPRRLAILAVALQEEGEPELALDAARRAENAEPGSLLPIVQQALILQNDLDDREGALERWEAVAEGGGGTLAAMLQALRGRVELERSGAGE